MSLRYDQVADLIKIIDASACDELVLETTDLKLSVRRRTAGTASPVSEAPPRNRGSTHTDVPPVPLAKVDAAPKAPGAPASSAEVRSPMVGTFYRAPSPEAPPFVEVGTQVSRGDALCVIEVMKLFTTIYADTAGRISQINAANGELVEYERLLFVIEPGG